MSLFADHPDQWRLLASHPSLANRAVEEVMRFGGTVSVVPRVTTEDLDVDGYLIPTGSLLMLSTISANYDADVYRDPTTFDITADREPHLTFGGGPHYCLGASLARAELQVALPMLAEAMPDLVLDGEPTFRPSVGIYGPDTLPIRFTPSA
jgi:cytochrome P450